MDDTRRPAQPDALERLQDELAARASTEPVWRPPMRPVVAGLWIAFARDERAWAAVWADDAQRVVEGRTGFEYVPGLFALRAGPLLQSAVQALGFRPDVLLVNATGRDHPRGAGLALNLGAACDVPTVGVTDRPLVAAASEPGPRRGDASPLLLRGATVGAALRTRTGARAVVVHAAWRTDPPTAVEVVLGVTARTRTPEPLRHARTLARAARAESGKMDA